MCLYSYKDLLDTLFAEDGQQDAAKEMYKQFSVFLSNFELTHDVIDEPLDESVKRAQDKMEKEKANGGHKPHAKTK